jgi:hypothetical protein
MRCYDCGQDYYDTVVILLEKHDGNTLIYRRVRNVNHTLAEHTGSSTIRPTAGERMVGLVTLMLLRRLQGQDCTYQRAVITQTLRITTPRRQKVVLRTSLSLFASM